MLPKEAYWVSKVIYQDTPSVHIIGHWNYPTGTIKNVYAAANCSSGSQAVLTVTNSLDQETTYNGVKSSTYLWTFENVEYEEGNVKVEIKNSNGIVQVSDSITSHGEPASLKITPIVSPEGLKADGSDVLLLDVEVLDSNGNRCQTFDGQTKGIYTYFIVNNQTQSQMTDSYCEWRGGYNSGIQYSTNKKYLYLEAGITRVALRTTLTAGQISITANMALENGTNLTDTYTTNSIAINNTNGYTTMQNTRLQYNISVLNPTTIGTGAIPEEIAEAVEEGYQSGLVENISYTGTNNWSLQPVLENGAKPYSDSEITFTSIPYKYLNAEYMQIPSTDNGELAVDLMNFTTTELIDVLVFRDPTVENPSWLSSYTLTNDIVTTSDGKMYRVYKKTISTVGTGINISGNGDTVQIGISGAMNIIAFKRTSQIATQTFFEENFKNSDGVPSYKGWTKIIGADTSITPEMLEEETTLHFVDSSSATNGGKFAETYKKFATQTGKLKFSYKAYIDSSVTNNYIRLFLHNGPVFEDPQNKTHFILETYINENTKLMYRTKTTENTNNYIKQNLTVNNWHTYEYEVDLQTKKFTVKIDNSTTALGPYDLYGGDYNSTNYVVIGTGGNAVNNFYMSTISVEPIASTAITSININGTAIPEFNVLTKDYLIKSASIPNITVAVRDSNVTSSIVFNEDNSKADIIVTDAANNNEVLTYTVYIEKGITNKTELRSLVSYINNLDEDCFEVSSWAPLQQELNKSELILSSEETTQINIENEINILKQKIRSLGIDRAAIRNKFYSND